MNDSIVSLTSRSIGTHWTLNSPPSLYLPAQKRWYILFLPMLCDRLGLLTGLCEAGPAACSCACLSTSSGRVWLSVPSWQQQKCRLLIGTHTLQFSEHLWSLPHPLSLSFFNCRLEKACGMWVEPNTVAMSGNCSGWEWQLLLEERKPLELPSPPVPCWNHLSSFFPQSQAICLKFKVTQVYLKFIILLSSFFSSYSKHYLTPLVTTRYTRTFLLGSSMFNKSSVYSHCADWGIKLHKLGKSRRQSVHEWWDPEG